MRFYWTAPDGETRAAHAWPQEDSRAVIACIHGLSGSGAQFQPLPERIAGYSFYALDLRGQGSDPVAARRGTMLDFSAQMRDIAAFVTALQHSHKGLPVFLMGESMGSLLAAGFSAWCAENGDHRQWVAGIILSVPVVGLRHEVPLFWRTLLRMLARIAPRTRLPPSRLVNGKALAPPLTRDRAYQDSLREKPHYIPAFSLGFLVELGDLIASSEPLARHLSLPTLVLAAGQDCFVRPDQIQTWFEKIPSPDKTLHLYQDAYHLLWHDWDRDRVVADVAAWLKARTD
jgi:alpha-beta hydrolase superfamily lysophospholipase